jgi:hypothetical protein
MALADRFRDWIDDLSDAWKDRLRGWMASWLEKGVYTLMSHYEPEIISLTQESLKKLKENPNLPPELKNVVDKALQEGQIYSVVLGWVITAIGAIPAILRSGVPLANLMEYYQERAIHSYRLSPAEVITAWRRDPATYEKYFDDLRDQGWSDDRLLALRLVTQPFPNVQDIIRFAVREAYTPEIAEKFGQYEDLPNKAANDLIKVGLPWEEFIKFWAAHWDLPSAQQGFEMLHRGVIDEETLKLLLRALDVMPFWRDKLTDIAWELPTRIDIRRFWDMRTIDEARLRELYAARGYHGKDLEDYVLWTKIYTDFPDLLARYKNGWITLDEVRREIIAMGLSPERADTLIEEKIKKAAPERVATEKNLTKADIVAGVKKGVITRGEGTELLMDIGYDPVEADYILAVSIPLDEENITVQKRELTKTDIIAGLKAGVITEQEALAKLIDLRYTTLDAQFLLQIYKATITPPVETRDREASKADIVLAVKKGLITPENGYLMLQDIGFTPEAAQFILMVQAESSPFSPMAYQEFKDITGKYRKAAGVEATPEVEELRKAGAEVIKLSKDLELLKASLTEEDRKLISAEVLPPEATKRRDELRVTLHRAESTLAAAKSHYDALVAEWRHKA